MNFLPLSQKVSKYTREAGVRGLERKLGALCRAAAVHMANHNAKQKTSKDDNENVAASAKTKHQPIEGNGTHIKEVCRKLLLKINSS